MPTMIHALTLFARCLFLVVSFFNEPATTEIYPLSLPDALPISSGRLSRSTTTVPRRSTTSSASSSAGWRSEEHTSELQSLLDLVCRLLLENKQILSPVYTTASRLSTRTKAQYTIH